MNTNSLLQSNFKDQPCRYGKNCKRKDCWFTDHTRDPVNDFYCSDGKSCTKATCPLSHGDPTPPQPKPCRYGSNCRFHKQGNCIYGHVFSDEDANTNAIRITKNSYAAALSKPAAQTKKDIITTPNPLRQSYAAALSKPAASKLGAPTKPKPTYVQTDLDSIRRNLAIYDPNGSNWADLV